MIDDVFNNFANRHWRQKEFRIQERESGGGFRKGIQNREFRSSIFGSEGRKVGTMLRHCPLRVDFAESRGVDWVRNDDGYATSNRRLRSNLPSENCIESVRANPFEVSLRPPVTGLRRGRDQFFSTATFPLNPAGSPVWLSRRTLNVCSPSPAGSGASRGPEA